MSTSIILAFALIGFVNAFEDPSRVRFEIFNEVTIMLVLYGIIGFIPLVEPKPRSVIGLVVCVVISFHFFVSISIILFSIVKQGIFRLRIWLAALMLAKQRSAK